ncbi:MAG: YncE family protein [Bacteroidota bacterium]|jgi:YVTN family beta-propeller protein
MKMILPICILTVLFSGSSLHAQGEQTSGPLDAPAAQKRPLLFVSHISENYVSVIDPATNRIVGRIKGGRKTMSVAISPLQDVGYIANYLSNDVTVFDQRAGKTLATVPAGEHPCYLNLTPDGRTLLIGHESDDGLWFMDTRTDSIVKKLPEGSGSFCQSKTSEMIYQSQIFTPFVDIIDPARLSIVKKISVGGRPMTGAITPDSRFLYVSNFDLQGVQKIDLTSDSVIGIISNVKNPRGIALSPDGRTAYVPDVVNSRLSIVDLTASTVVKTVRVGSQPVSVVLDGDGSHAYVACQSGASVSVIDTRTGSLIHSIPVDWDPIQIAFLSAYAPPFDSLSAISSIAMHPFDSLNPILVDNLCRKKVVMIGDGYHEHGTFMRLVTGLLNRWVDTLEAEKKEGARSAGLSAIPHKLMLFLEADSEQLALKLRSIRSGDAAPWLASMLKLETEWGHLIGGTSVDVVEYTAALNRILDRVARLNAKDSTHPYDFKIMGPEGVPPYKPFDRGQTRDTAEIRKKRLEWGRTKFNWFAHERDRITSSAVWKALTEHPDYKGVVFYGTAHLMRERQNKADLGGREYGIDSAYDYYLAHFLDGYFGRDSVAVFFSHSNPGAEEASIAENAHRGEIFDYNISCTLVPRGPSPLELMPSRTVLAAFRELMRDSEKEGNEHGRMFGRLYAFRLYLQLKRSNLNGGIMTRPLLDSIRAHMWDTSAAAAARRDVLFDSLIAVYDGISSIDSLQNWLTRPANDSSFYNEMLNLVIMNIPGADSVHDFRNPVHLPLDTTMQAFVRAHHRDLVEYFLVNLLWIGTPDEKARALISLTMLTGQSYRTAEEWSEWWRGRYQ